MNTAQIDAVARKAFRIGLGPFGLMNLTGPPIALHSTDYLAEQLGTRRDTMNQTTSESWLMRVLMWAIEDGVILEVSIWGNISPFVRVVLSVAAQIVAEGVCSMEDVDRGAMGLRWARGPFELMNKVGVKNSYEMAEDYLTLCAKMRSGAMIGTCKRIFLPPKHLTM